LAARKIFDLRRLRETGAGCRKVIGLGVAAEPSKTDGQKHAETRHQKREPYEGESTATA
jgi:hypothetical protein